MQSYLSSLSTLTMLVLLCGTAPATARQDPVQIVNRKATILVATHKKARKALVNAAQDEAYAELAKTGHVHADHHIRRRVDTISKKVQDRFDVEEMCLIAVNGNELSRIVGKEIAHDLSEDETGAPFFAPSFALPPRHTYISRPYLSPDANKWVVAYTTPIVDEGKTVAVLHFEHGLNVFQDLLNQKTDEKTIVLAVSADGWLVSDSRQPISIAAKSDAQGPEHYFQRFTFGGADLDGVRSAVNEGRLLADNNGTQYRVAYKMVNDWTVVVLVHQEDKGAGQS